jgi:transcriptional regulator with XRE-family HTH domain
LRAELNLKQSQLAQEAQVGVATVSVAERKMRVSQFSAYKMYHALNRLRAKAGLPPITFEEIAWT